MSESKRVDPRAIALYDEYTHAPLPRRVFLEKLAVLAGGATAAAALLPILENDYARAQTIERGDKRITQVTAAYKGTKGSVYGYMARPSKGEDAPGVVVIHENRGLNEHITDVVRRLAVAGFVGMAPDFLSSMGGTPVDPDRAREMIGELDPATALADLRAGVAWLAKNKATTGKVGAVGFCWGGAMVNNLAVAEPTLRAAVVFYGMSPPLDGVKSIKAPLLLHYAGDDERVNATVPDYEAALKAAGRTFTLYRYEGAAHAFHNDSNAARYNKEAATLAWQRTVDFLKQKLA